MVRIFNCLNMSKCVSYSLIHDYNSKNSNRLCQTHCHLRLSGTVLATDGECPDRYESPICAVALCFPEALLSLSILYLRIHPVTASMSYLIQFMPYDKPCAESWRRSLFMTQHGQRVRILALAHNPIASNL
jgi:hypothetical protein